MPKVRTGLGRGFDALLPQQFDASLLMNEGERILHINVGAITANSEQPRRHFDETALEQLADSIKRHGVLQPLIVTPQGEGNYMLVAGERRWRAATKAGLKTVPVIARTARELERLELALVENVQRVDLSPLEQAASIERLYQQFNLTYETIAKRLGKAVSTVHNIARLLQLPPEAQKALQTEAITEGHARAVLALKDHPTQQAELLRLIQTQGWSVRQAERFVNTVKKGGAQDSQTARARMRSETPETRRLGKRLKSSVSIRRTAHGGKLEIGFTSDDDLERLITLLLG